MSIVELQRALLAYVQERRNEPFAWGSNDCATFALKFAHDVRGDGSFEEHREHGTTAKEVLRYAKSVGGLAAVCDAVMQRRADPSLATTGDVVLVSNGSREMLALCAGMSVIAPSTHGVEFLSRELIVAAWIIQSEV